jgi:aspartate/methionine/tyrosine aminotransferase
MPAALFRFYSAPVLSRRSGRSLAPNALAELLAQSAPPLFDLCASNPTRAGIAYPEAVPEALARAVARSSSYAPEPFGAVSARAAVARHFATTRGLAAPPETDDVLLTASTSEAYSFLFKLLGDPGDQVLVPAPSYPLLEHLAELEALELAPYRLAYDGAWHIDLDSLRSALTPRTRALIVVSPNNPTGHYLAPGELAALEQLGLPILNDEVFFEYAHAGRQPSYAVSQQALGFTLGGLSKLVGAPQLKLAWTILSGPEAARREARARLELIADTFLSVSTAVQLALPEILDAAPSITSSIRARCRLNLEALASITGASALTPLRCEGGWSAVLRLPAVASEDDFVVGLLREQGVLVQPGWFYDFETQPFVIVSLLTEPSTFRQGCERLVDHVTRVAG